MDMDLKINSIQMPTFNETSKINKKVNDDFKFTLLSKLDDGELQEKLQMILKEINLQGDKISKHMDIRDMKMYRTLITEFFGEIISRSHKFSRENFLDRRGRHRVYGIIKLVNNELDELAKELIDSEKSNIKILNRIDEIRGLLLDIFT